MLPAENSKTTYTADLPAGWITVVGLWFIVVSALIIGLSFWAIQGIPAYSDPDRRSIPVKLPEPPPLPTLPPATEEQVKLYERQTAAYLKAAEAYKAAATAAQQVNSLAGSSPRLGAYKNVAVEGLLAMLKGVVTLTLTATVTMKALQIVEKSIRKP